MMISFLYALAALFLIYAALHDLAARTVPNWLPLSILSVGAIVRLIDHSFVPGVAICLATFLVLFVIWMFGGMGGGDVKLWAATALLIPPTWEPELTFVLRVVVLGGILAVLYLGLCLIVSKPRASRAGGILQRIMRVEAWRISRRAPLPYAFAIAGGAISTLLPFSFQH
jgi:prepilin peptidase CpaA